MGDHDILDVLRPNRREAGHRPGPRGKSSGGRAALEQAAPGKALSARSISLRHSTTSNLGSAMLSLPRTITKRRDFMPT